ncbi:MAG: hypothetical protein ACI4JG_07045 [Acutalibacteraceae bacterium]
MKRKIAKVLSLSLALILCVCSFSSAFAASGVPDGYTPIYTAEDLNNIRNNLSGKFILMNDIDLSAYENWQPIGTLQAPFCGKFDGNSFTVKNINISEIEGENPSAGLFGTVENSQIKDVTVIGQIDVNNDNGIRAGLICGEAYNSVVTNCITYGKIDVTTKAAVWVGGIAGFLSQSNEEECKIEQCQNNAAVTANGFCSYKPEGINYFVGGIAGISEGLISKCSNYGEVTAIGRNNGYDYFYTLAGGICGNSDGEINNCYNIGNISSVGTKYVFAGGISGFWYQFEDIYNCYNIGQVKAEVKEATDKYNYSNIGGIIGVVESLVFPDSSDPFADYPASIRNCYYLDNVENAFGDASPQNQINVKSLATDEILKQDSFVGFDFESVWTMGKNGYPILGQSTEPSAPDYKIASAKILYVPLKNHIVFNFGSPALPDGIVVKITYKDGTTQNAVIKRTDDGYFANGEKVTGSMRPAVVEYGILTDTLFFNDGQIKIEYKYLALPPIFTIIKSLI